MSPRPRMEDEENESFKVPLEDESETATQLRQRRQIQIGAVSRIEWPWRLFTSISVAFFFILVTLFLAVELYQSPGDFGPGSIAPKPQSALYFLVMVDVAMLVWLSIKLFCSHLTNMHETVSYTKIRNQKGSEMDYAWIMNTWIGEHISIEFINRMK